jgi:arabinoxylan arabinofuranohydrolase
MKLQAFNPYLPGYEYIPDGEPYLFHDRVYVYGSHDRFGGKIFCLNDYVCWSAPAEDLGDWRYEGIIYRRKQDPRNPLGLRLLFAPDIVRGADGRFYLYYAFDFMGIMGVAVCDSPCGEFKFLGHVHYPDGTLWGRKKGDAFPFDPGVLLDDDGRIYLYFGFYTPVPAIVTGGKKLNFEGGYVLELEADMVTVKTPTKLLFPKEGKDSFRRHEFFEASSIRKYAGKYYFVYSSRHNHELCYAVSDKPAEGFRYGGTLISNGDIFERENTEEKKASNYIGNNHGGLLKIKDQYYIFYHRHTNRTSYARQACAERLEMDEKGEFQQAEMTSCGLNGGPLEGEGRYEARIACNLWSAEGTGRYDIPHAKRIYRHHPYFTQEGKDGDITTFQYVANMENGAVAGFKYFKMEGADELSITIRGEAKGEMQVSDKKDFSSLNTAIAVEVHGRAWREFAAPFKIEKGEKALYFRFTGNGSMDFAAFQLRKKD